VRFGDWVDGQGQRIEQLYDTESRERGNLVVDIGATYDAPQELACFPGQDHPAPEYTFQGWIDATLDDRDPANRTNRVRAGDVALAPSF